MVLIAAPQKLKEKLLLTPDLTLDIAKNILKTMEVGSKWVSQASSIKLENKNEVKIKQEVTLNLAKIDKRKGSTTSEAGSSVPLSLLKFLIKLNLKVTSWHRQQRSRWTISQRKFLFSVNTQLKLKLGKTNSAKSFIYEVR